MAQVGDAVVHRPTTTTEIATAHETFEGGVESSGQVGCALQKPGVKEAGLLRSEEKKKESVNTVATVLFKCLL